MYPQVYAGLAVAICFVLGMVGRGLLDAYAVFVLPLSGAFDWDRASVASVYALAMATTGLAAPVVGWLFDRWGPARLYLLGLALLGAGAGGAGWYQELWHFYLGLGVVAGFGVAALSFVPHAALLRRWYRARLTTALGVVYASNGLGVLLIAPLAQLLIEQYGWRQAYHLIGFGPLILLPVMVLVPWRRLAAGHPDLNRAAPAARPAEAEDRWTLARALRSRPFWALFAVYALTAGGLYPINLQLVAYLVEAGYPALTAASAYGMTGILATAGLLGFSALADRIGRQYAVTLSYLATNAGLVILFFIGIDPTMLLLVAFVALFGAAFGSRAPIISSFAAGLFGRSNRFGAILGTITLAQGLGGGLGTVFGGALHDWTGGYVAVLVFGFTCIALACANFWLVPELARR